MEMNMTNLLWFFAFIFLAGGNGFGGLFGNRGPMGPPPATQTDVNAAINNQTIQSLIGSQTDTFLQTNSANQINMIQGFNQIIQNLQNQTANLGQQISQLGYQLDSCCCGIKTQMLQDRLADKTAEAIALQNKIDNRDQTAQILSNLGRFVAWAGSGSPAATAAGISG